MVLMAGGGKKITADDVAHMFKRLTGKEATPEELATVRDQLDAAYGKLAASPDIDKPSVAQLIAQQIASIGPFT